MDTKLDSLSAEFKPKAIELLARLLEANVPCKIINTRRTDEEQAINLATGRSWIKRSKHQDGNAIDVCPYLVFRIDGEDKLQWNPNYPIWGKVGAIGEAVGLKWGVWKESDEDVPAWRRRGKFVNLDLGHFELPTDV